MLMGVKYPRSHKGQLFTFFRPLDPDSSCLIKSSSTLHLWWRPLSPTFSQASSPLHVPFYTGNGCFELYSLPQTKQNQWWLSLKKKRKYFLNPKFFLANAAFLCFSSQYNFSKVLFLSPVSARTPLALSIVESPVLRNSFWYVAGAQ